MKKSKMVLLGLLTASSIFITGCSDKKIADLSQKELQEIVQNLPNKEREIFEQYIKRNEFQHRLTRVMGKKEEVNALKPYDQVSVKEAIKIEKEFISSKN
ncbi:hypothetical protein [Delftia tsuruhatensis]|uniref:hypothetical protein n=1 Tax=Delftia tsuruhatensis TaxID=180282 RepID=UPI003A8C232E